MLIEDQFIIFLIDVYGNGYFHDQIFFDVDWYFFDDCLNLPYFILVKCAYDLFVPLQLDLQLLQLIELLYIFLFEILDIAVFEVKLSQDSL